jgi:peptidylprolyl isomerase
MNRTIISILSLISAFTYAEEPATPLIEVTQIEPVVLTEAIVPELTEGEISQKILAASEALGVLMAKSIPPLDLKIDTEKMVQGFKDALQGHEKLKTQMECVQVVVAAQEAVFKVMAVENLKKTEEFLAQNKSVAGVQELEANKLQYLIEKEGSGPAVESTSTPIIRYTVKFLDQAADEVSPDENRIDLSEVDLFPGFKKGLLGMKEGEKRVVYVHPDLGFPTKEYNRHTNSLLTCEIEVLQANAPAEKPLDSFSGTHPHAKNNPEIAQPLEEHKAVR